MKIIDVTAGIIEKDGRFLIAKRKKGKHLEGKWEFPGGKVEPEEKPEECLCRELREEFCIKTKVGDFLTESIFKYKERKIRLLGYYVKYISGKFQLNDHDEIQWITVDDFYKYDFAEADMPLVEKIVAHKGVNPESFR